MASKKNFRGKKSLLAALAEDQEALCAFCQQGVDDEVTFGKLYAIGDIECHYFCALLSCCLVQKGRDSEGLFGFLYPDIVAEVERSKKHKCSFCNKGGAGLGCCVSQCRKQFHLPCGRERNAVSLFYGNYKSYCQQHAPKQKLPDHIKALSLPREKKAKSAKLVGSSVSKELQGGADTKVSQESVCVICYEEVAGYPTPQTFWPPCCARDAWFHRSCLQRMALSAGMHYLKCPLCNDKEQFYDAVVNQGYYVPDRDAAWELEQNAFAEIYERPLCCSADQCRCPSGREHDSDNGPWDIKLCILCGTSGIHAACLSVSNNRFVCAVCQPAAPTDMDTLAKSIEAVPFPMYPYIKLCILCGTSGIHAACLCVSNNRFVCAVCQPAAPTDMDTLAKSIEAVPFPMYPYIKLCILCGTSGIHAACLCVSNNRFMCAVCQPAAPTDMDTLAKSIEAVILSEQARERQNAAKHVMPSRMSLRRTKARAAYNAPSTSRSNTRMIVENEDKETNTSLSRSELNLTTPKKLDLKPPSVKSMPNIFSPTKIIEESLNKKLQCTGADFDTKSVICKVKDKLRKPRPLSVKKKIVSSLLDELYEDMIEQVKNSQEKCSPKKRSSFVKEEKTPEKPTEPITQDPTETVWPVNTPKKLPLENLPPTENLLPTENLPPTILLPTEETQDCFENASENPKVCTESDDESSNSTFQLPPEFIAEQHSDDSLPLFETPKKLKTVDIQKDSSMEISENDEVVNIDVVKIKENPNKKIIDSLKISIPLKTDKCSFKFNPIDKETLQETDLNIDMESFKNQYLNEVDRAFKCNYSHKNKHEIKKENPVKLRTAIDFARDATKKKEREKLKRKLATQDKVAKKKRKKSKIRKSNCKENSNIKVSYSNNDSQIDLTLESPTGKISKKRLKKNKKSRDNIQVKIRFRKEQLRLKITKKETKKVKKQKSKTFKQYILQYPVNSSPSKILAKPDHDVTPRKRNYVKLEKSPDNLVQTSIQSFFKKMTVKEEKLEE